MISNWAAANNCVFLDGLSRAGPARAAAAAERMLLTRSWLSARRHPRSSPTPRRLVRRRMEGGASGHVVPSHGAVWFTFLHSQAMQHRRWVASLSLCSPCTCLLSALPASHHARKRKISVRDGGATAVYSKFWSIFFKSHIKCLVTNYKSNCIE